MANTNRNRKSTRTATTASASRKATAANRVNAASTGTDSVTFVSPRGKSYSVDNVSKFATRFNLDRSALSKVARGERQQHKGWTAQG